MTPIMKTVLWGEALEVKAKKVRGGMNAIADVARSVCGPTVGGRTTFSKLYASEGVPEDAAARFRVWIIATVLGDDPEEWGVSDDDVPSGYDPNSLREQVILASRWMDASAA